MGFRCVDGHTLWMSTDRVDKQPGRFNTQRTRGLLSSLAKKYEVRGINSLS